MAVKTVFQLLPKEFDAKVAKIAFSSTRCELSAIESSCRSRLALELDGQHFFAVEGSCRRKISKWKSRAQVVRELPQVPQGTTASTTPPFVRAGYDCRNKTTVLRRPEAAGRAPLVCAGPLTTSLSGTVGQWPPATGQWWNERRGGDPKTDQRKEELSKQLGCEGRDPRTLASWRH